ncbi:MAG: neutral/alkaline non-lysosomal ceramidase N-terminal domain-containing protein [Bryobacteraceae bacterium]
MRLFIALLTLGAALPALGALRAGAAVADVEAPNGIQLVGYTATGREATGTRDPLEARAIVFEDGTRRIALVTLDLIFTPLEPEMQSVRERVRARAQVADVIFVASHTHSGPSIFSGSAPLVDSWLPHLVDRIAFAIETAASRLEPIAIGAGWGQTQIGANRRYQPVDSTRPNSPEIMWWRNSTKASSFPVDPTVGVIRVDKANGQPLAILVNYACHPVIFGPDNRRYSADYPGAMRRTIEAAFPGVTAYFLQGAPGDINPYYDKTPLIENADAHVEKAGRQLGEEAIRVARAIRAAPLRIPELGLKVYELTAQWRYDRAQSEALFNRQPGRKPIPRYPLWGDPPKLPVTTFVIGREFAFAGMPAEPFLEFQMNLRARSPLPFTFFLGYCNGNINYIPTIQAAARGGYGADNTITRVEPGTGEEMIHRALVAIYQLTGRMK